MRTLLVTAYTPGYTDLAERLGASADEHDCELLRVPYESTGDWVRNGHIKPLALMKAMERHPLRPVCWVDADAIIRKPPVLLDEMTGDVAYHRVPKTQETLSGTVWTRSQKFVRAWAGALEGAPGEWDQRLLLPALVRSDVRFSPLPAEYCWVDYFAEPRWGGPREPVIEHTQASRDVRAGKRAM